MKKKVIKSITLIAIGALLVGVPVGAATYISSRDIEYTTEHNENITNVNEALDDLISNVDEIKTSGTATSSDILSGKTAYVKGNLITGTRTAQNDSYEVKYNTTAQEPSGTNCIQNYSFTPTESGKVLVSMHVARNIQGLNTAWTKSVNVGGKSIAPTRNFSNIWTGHAYWEANVSANQSVSINSTTATASNASTVCGLTVIYVKL